MKQYLDLLRHIRENGTMKSDRTGTGTQSVFGYQTRYDLSEGFPLLTTKKLHLKSIIYELLWFIAGDTNVKYLQEHGVRIWNEWADENGDLGPVYGHQWRSWPTPDGGTIDQLSNVINQIKNSPDSRRMIVSAWNVAEVDKMALPPCHSLFQFYVADGKLSCQLYQRSADVFLGVPFNIASYALLTMMVAQVCGLQPGEFVHTTGDTHIYTNHFEQVALQLTREPRKLPKMMINPEVKSIFDFKFEDFELVEYDPHPHIAISDNNAIGRDNALLWHISEDLKFFRRMTSGHPVIMGRKTYESIGRPLPKRTNIVVSRGQSAPEGTLLAASLEGAFELAESAIRVQSESDGAMPERCFVIGGGQIYAQAMELADRLVITHVHTVIENADTFFPEIDPKQWKVDQRSEMYTDEETGYTFEFVEYIR